ncbi:subunit 17 of mediator complex-domain-containing protein [Amylocystis lapponica]|nr:subunit 17 of mediator complex-domain-containing protein [Amylocystis lapponica]
MDKKFRLSLERPYKRDNGEPIPTLLDITPDGQHIYEVKEDASTIAGQNLRRIFAERGADFFESRKQSKTSEPQTDSQEDPPDDTGAGESPQAMNPDELFKMRTELLPQLHVALGEMSQARDLLTLLLASPTLSQSSQPPSSSLGVTLVTKPPPVPSLRAFNAQLTVGSKDKALRKAADLFKSAATSMEIGRIRGEKYWVDALKIRRGNWGLVPAPLPLGSATGKGADKTSKDFLVAFGLEESPPLFRRRAIGRMPTYESDASELEFPLRQRTRLQVSITTTDSDGIHHTAQNCVLPPDNASLEGSLRAAQTEVVEQELFSMLINEAGNLPTASARVSERLIVIEAAQGTDLRFELVDGDMAESPASSQTEGATCDLIFAALHVLLLRTHAFLKSQRLMRTSVSRSGLFNVVQTPRLLQPVIDILQYRTFCERVHTELGMVVRVLHQAGIPTKLHFEAVGGSGEELVAQLIEGAPKPIGGETLLRFDNRHTLRFTLISPSSLIAHLPQATLTIASIPQLIQLLVDEVSGCILNRICDIGSEMCSRVSATWFVDLLTGRSVGRWEGCVL